MAYVKNPTWANTPSTATPIMAAILQKYETALYELSNGFGLPASRFLTGSGDETAAFKAWIAAAKASGEIMVGDANKTITISETLDMRAHGLTYIGNGMRIVNTGTDVVGVMLGGFQQCISGLSHRYSTQAADTHTNSAGVEFYAGYECLFQDIHSDNAYDSYRLAQSGWEPVSTTNNTLFSCLLNNIYALGYSHRVLEMRTWPAGGASSTGCVWQNLYFHNNPNGVQPCSASPVLFFDWDESAFHQVNIEWTQPPANVDLWFMQRCQNMSITSMHVEGVPIAGSAGIFRTWEGVFLKVQGLSWVNTTLPADGGRKSVIHSGNGSTLPSRIEFDGLKLRTLVTGALVTSGGSIVLADLGADMAAQNCRLEFTRVQTESLTSQAGPSAWVIGDDPLSPCVQRINDTFFGVQASDPNRLITGQSTMPRDSINSGTAATMTSGTVRFAFFTAESTFTATSMRLNSGTTAAGATPTLVRCGLYTVSASGDLTLVAAIASDTALLAAANTAYTRAFSTGGSLPATYQLIAGRRYAIGIIVVTAATAPTLPGQIAVVASEMGLAPRVAASLAGQSNLPTAATAASLADSTSRPYAVAA